jgi:hypothetical protein
MKGMYIFAAIMMILAMVMIGCSEKTIVNNVIYAPDTGENGFHVTADDFFEINAAKWSGNKTASISITYDARWRGTGRDPMIDQAINDVLSRYLTIDFELVTANYVDFPDIIASMHTDLVAHGIGFFGHGHKHDIHDTFDFDYCLKSFSLCYQYMKQWGFNPRTYAYPGWSGYEPTTQAAMNQSGFIAARGKVSLVDSMFICPGNTSEPENWYYLPSVAFAQKNAYDINSYVNTHDEFMPILVRALDETAWIILTYHSIGFDDGWGFYPFEEFHRDLDAIASADFWCASMDNISCYIKERNALEIKTEYIGSTASEFVCDIIFSDKLSDRVYDQPLTINFTFTAPKDIASVRFEPSLNGQKTYVVTGNRLSLDVLPDDRKYRLFMAH